MSWPTPHNWRQLRHEPREIATFAILLTLTVVTMTVAGHWHMSMFVELTAAADPSDRLAMWVGALQFTAALLAILGAHEYGHYWMGHYYCLKTALPRFLPGPTIAGTLGAFLLIERHHTSREASFDIAAAGPVGGFIVCIPTVWLGLMLSVTVPAEAAAESGLLLGTPALMALARGLIHGPLESAQTLALHPIATAGWVGLLVTSLNLLPAGPLDGGRIATAIGGAATGRFLGWATTMLFAVWSYHEPTWTVWTLLMFAFTIASHRAQTPDAATTPLDAPRAWAAGAIACIALVSFTARPLL